MQQKLCLETIGEIDGGSAALIIDKAIADAVHDLDDRGEDGKPRQVHILLILQRMDNGLIEAHVEAEAKAPKRRTASHIAQLKRDGGSSDLLFQQYDSSDPSQRTIDEMEGE